MNCKLCDKPLKLTPTFIDVNDFIYICDCGFSGTKFFDNSEIIDLLIGNVCFNLYFENNKLASYGIRFYKQYHEFTEGNFLTIKQFEKVFDFKNLKPILDKVKIYNIFK